MNFAIHADDSRFGKAGTGPAPDAAGEPGQDLRWKGPGFHARLIQSEKMSRFRKNILASASPDRAACKHGRQPIVMDNKPLVLLCLALGGMLFLGAEPNNSSIRYNRTYRGHPEQNISVIASGILVISTPGGEWVCDRTDVMSVSAHTYQIEGGMRVWEVTASERSSTLVKFYYTEPLVVDAETAGTPDEEGTGGKLDTLRAQSTTVPAPKPEQEEDSLLVPVRKTYPETTHAHIVEFRARDREEVENIYAYLCLKVYGWSPRIERPPSAREYEHLKSDSAWYDWDVGDKQKKQ